MPILILILTQSLLLPDFKSTYYIATMNAMLKAFRINDGNSFSKGSMFQGSLIGKLSQILLKHWLNISLSTVYPYLTLSAVGKTAIIINPMILSWKNLTFPRNLWGSPTSFLGHEMAKKGVSIAFLLSAMTKSGYWNLVF